MHQGFWQLMTPQHASTGKRACPKLWKIKSNLRYFRGVIVIKPARKPKKKVWRSAATVTMSYWIHNRIHGALPGCPGAWPPAQMFRELPLENTWDNMGIPNPAAHGLRMSPARYNRSSRTRLARSSAPAQATVLIEDLGYLLQ